MHKHIIICTGGRLGDWAIPYLRDYDYLIGADKGAFFLADRGYRMDAALGDFDSVSVDQLALIREYGGRMTAFDPVDKDYTDTELAFRHALLLKPERITLLGALGSRFDHTLANVHLLAAALSEGIEACVVDDHNRISLTDSRFTVRRSMFTHVSLLPLSAQVTGITLTGFEYPLHQATLRIGQSLGISNVLAAREGLIEVKEGLLLVIESRD